MVLEAPVVTVDASGARPAPSVSMASPGPWACPAVALGAPKYGLGESTWLISDPAPGEGNGVEPAGPVTGPAKYDEAPHPARGRVGAHGTLSPLIPPPSQGEV